MLNDTVALLCNPECAKKAQAEIDAVVGQTRLPSFEDEAALPYLKAMIKESMRLVTLFQFSHFPIFIFVHVRTKKVEARSANRDRTRRHAGRLLRGVLYPERRYCLR